MMSNYLAVFYADRAVSLVGQRFIVGHYNKGRFGHRFEA